MPLISVCLSNYSLVCLSVYVSVNIARTAVNKVTGFLQRKWNIKRLVIFLFCLSLGSHFRTTSFGWKNAYCHFEWIKWPVATFMYGNGEHKKPTVNNIVQSFKAMELTHMQEMKRSPSFLLRRRVSLLLASCGWYKRMGFSVIFDERPVTLNINIFTRKWNRYGQHRWA